jgi:hypothetical protein
MAAESPAQILSLARLRRPWLDQIPMISKMSFDCEYWTVERTPRHGSDTDPSPHSEPSKINSSIFILCHHHTNQLSCCLGYKLDECTNFISSDRSKECKSILAPSKIHSTIYRPTVTLTLQKPRVHSRALFQRFRETSRISCSILVILTRHHRPLPELEYSRSLQIHRLVVFLERMNHIHIRNDLRLVTCAKGAPSKTFGHLINIKVYWSNYIKIFIIFILKMIIGLHDRYVIHRSWPSSRPTWSIASLSQTTDTLVA